MLLKRSKSLWLMNEIQSRSSITREPASSGHHETACRVVISLNADSPSRHAKSQANLARTDVFCGHCRSAPMYVTRCSDLGNLSVVKMPALHYVGRCSGTTEPILLINHSPADVTRWSYNSTASLSSRVGSGRTIKVVSWLKRTLFTAHLIYE